MKIAIVHDYIKEYGGAERVLEALSEIYPKAPIYTAFCDTNSTAYKHFKNKKHEEKFFEMVKKAFGSKRKMLRSTLGIDSNARPEDLPLSELLELSK